MFNILAQRKENKKVKHKQVKQVDNRIDRTEPHIRNIVKILFGVLLICPLIGTLLLSSTYAAPQGPIIIYNSTETITPQPAASITTAGGSFTTILLNATQQTPRWKAYVGNVTGRLVLDDSTSKSIFDWSLASVTGEVYASRNSSIDWSSIRCANSSTIINEDIYLNMSQDNPDTINKTFANKVHKAFYVGNVLIQNSTCNAIATYVNDTAQPLTENADFQEILLQDTFGRLVYTTIINQNKTGFNLQKYDFQLIVAENEYQTTPTTYYIYVELT
ncbi:MAG: hypothetical protein KatS3mg002_1227 [Candidatus Woesearchaeota archaeon]|nr:MAG: hypothetical protein KatS3mg002_1227 [Candidatus Woesearchaeota archaeon]